MPESVGEDPPVEPTVGTLREIEESFMGVSAGLKRGVDVDEVPGERPPVECAHFVRDRVVRMEHRTDGHEDGLVGTPVHPEFDLGNTTAVGNCQPGERVVLPLNVDGQAIVPVRVHDGGDCSGELLAAVPGGEQVNVFAGPLEKAGGWTA